MNTEHGERRRLEAAECTQVLAAAEIGRIALTERALPIILPVSYEFDGGAVRFPATPQTLARAAKAGHVVCFEADSVDPDGAIRSVNIIGRLEPTVAPANVRDGSDPPAAEYARLSTATVSGTLFAPDRIRRPGLSRVRA